MDLYSSDDGTNAAATTYIYNYKHMQARCQIRRSKHDFLNLCFWRGALLLTAAVMFPRTGLSAAISACEKGTAWMQAVSTLDAATSVKPDVICISAVASALENCASNSAIL